MAEGKMVKIGIVLMMPPGKHNQDK